MEVTIYTNGSEQNVQQLAVVMSLKKLGIPFHFEDISKLKDSKKYIAQGMPYCTATNGVCWNGFEPQQIFTLTKMKTW